MITLLVNENNPLSQTFYNELIEGLALYQISCPGCKCTGRFVIHGYYKRTVTTGAASVSIRIQRIRCNSCSKTQSLLTSQMVPYSQIALSTQVKIIEAVEKKISYSSIEAKLSISLYCINHIISNYYKCWKQMKLIASLDFSNLSKLSQLSFANYSLQFMQIRNTANSLWVNTT